MAAMSRLLDQALPLDAAGRRAWLERLPAEHQDLASALHQALFRPEPSGVVADRLLTLPKLGDSADGDGPAPSGLVPGARVGPYELRRRLGAGGMAEVWLARRADGAFKREVALKLPLLAQRADLAARFAHERDILASLEHPHIARLYDAGVDDAGSPYIAMEYVEGRTLAAWSEAQELALPARLELYLQVLDAVQYAHDKQVIHRDLKPSNILVTPSGQVRLLDFGVAKLLQSDGVDQTALTSTFGRALTPDFASPELLRGDPVDARSDVYALGVLLYELLTGARPYRLSTAASVGLLDAAVAAVEVRKPSLQAPRRLGPQLDAITLKALAKDPAMRYATVAALADDVRRYLDGRPVAALSERRAGRGRRFVERHRAILALGAVMAVALAASVGFLDWQRLHATPPEDWRDPLLGAKVTRLTDFVSAEQSAAISRDGRMLAYTAEHDGHADAWVMEIASGAQHNLTNGAVGGLGNPALRAVGFSPDGALVTLWTRTADGSRREDIKIIAVPTHGGAPRPYLKDAAEFDWSADGLRVVFHTTAAGDPLFVQSGDGAARQIYVAPPGVHCHFPTWSRDGDFIYFVRGIPPAHWDVWRIRATGEDPERITFHDARVSFPVLLDGRTLLYLATDADSTGPRLQVMDLQRKRARPVGVGLERYTSLAASADGMRIVTTVANVRTDLWRIKLGDGPPATSAVRIESVSPGVAAPRFGPGYLAFVSSAGGRHGIWKLAADTVVALWEDPDADSVGAPTIAPDGRRIAFTVTKGGAVRLYVMSSDGGRPQEIGLAQTPRGDLAWTPDSQALIGAVLLDGEPRLARIPLDGSAPQPLASEYSLDPVWSPDGKFFVYSGADVGTTFPLRAADPDGRPFGMSSLILTRGARRVAFAGNSGSLVILRGEIGHKNFWMLDPRSGASRQLTDLPSNYAIGDFDVSPDGSEIVFDRQQENSSIALIQRAAR